MVRRERPSARTGATTATPHNTTSPGIARRSFRGSRELLGPPAFPPQYEPTPRSGDDDREGK